MTILVIHDNGGMKLEKHLLYKITFRSYIMQFYVTSGFYYLTFDDFKENRKHHNQS